MYLSIVDVIFNTWIKFDLYPQNDFPSYFLSYSEKITCMEKDISNH